MKQAIFAVALLALSAGSIAQSTVTMFGTVDQYVSYARSGPTSSLKIEDGGNQASRLGFTGSEDLGGGLRANFMMEAGIAVDTGAGTLPGPGLGFTRQSFVGLSGNWGRVDVGRMYTPMFYSLFRADAFAFNAIYSPLNLIGSIDAQSGLSPFAARSSNMVRYRTPSDSRFMLDLAYAPGEAATASRSSGDFYGGSIGWNQAPFYVAYAFQKARSGTGALPVESPVTSTYQAFSGYWNATEALRLSANLMRTSVALARTPSADLVNVEASWAVGVARLMAGVIRRTVDGSPRSQLGWTLGADYNLSKRTALYTRLLHLANQDGASATLAGVPVVVNSGNSLSSWGVGVRHNF